ncbi:hypothetical protein [Trueperella pyogenes]|uniref:hypothetical protein n=1 Tax=Trueperella pyogenes TaxID=1661 RepID=UPI00312BA0BC
MVHGVTLYSHPIPNSTQYYERWIGDRKSEFREIQASGLRLHDVEENDPRALRKIARQRGLTQPHRGYICPAPAPDDERRRRIASLHHINYIMRRRMDRANSQAVSIAGHSAAVLLGLPLMTPHPDHVVRQCGPRGKASRTANARTHRSSIEPETIDFLGFKVSSPAQIVADLARFATVEDALVCANFILHEQLATRESIVAILKRLPPSPGIGRLRRVVRLMDGRVESVGESLLLLRLDDFRLLPAEPQVWFEFGTVRYRCDFLDREKRLVYEFDGRAKLYTPSMLKDNDVRASIARETDRDRHFRAAGFDPLHVVWQDVITREAFGNWLTAARARGVRFA